MEFKFPSLTILFFSIFSFSSFSQGEWTWMSGDSSGTYPAVYGIKGVPSPANIPGGRQCASKWTDNNDNLWLFGGRANSGILNDLWKYDPLTNEWTWMSGDNIPYQNGVYGTKGISSPLNKPGARDSETLCWTDNNGKFWLFGGQGNGGQLNDLWKYDPIINEWTWVSGSNTFNQSGIYGTKGVSSASNVPGARDATTCSWVDNNGDLWLFGGRVSGKGRLNDLWKYTISTNEWIWMSGSNLLNQNGVYGIKGVPSPSNVPSARYCWTSWADKNNNLWLFGSESENDLWKYNLTTNQWTWVSGSNTIHPASVYGTKCIESVSNMPGLRPNATARWIDDCGNLFLFGGRGYIGGGAHNDLWRYNPNTDKWTWISGDNILNQLSIFGTKGVASPTNKPGNRQGGVSWINKKNELWLFGGFPWANWWNTNDLWKYTFEPPTTTFTDTACSPLTKSFNIDLRCSSTKSQSWNFGDPLSGINNSSSLANPVHKFSAAGTYNVKVVITNCSGNTDSITQLITVTADRVANAGNDMSICEGNSAQLSGEGGGTYLWKPPFGLSNTTIANPLANPSSPITYELTVYNANCFDIDSVNVIVFPLPTVNAGENATIKLSQSVQLNGSGNGTYSWSPSDGLSCTDCSNPIATPYITTTYYLTVTSDDGCTRIDSVTIYVEDCEIFVPNAFSANGDGNNDELFVQSICTKEIELAIYDRWGERVFTSNDINKKWNGAYNGEEMNTGVYMYSLKAILLNDKIVEKKGNITLLR